MNITRLAATPNGAKLKDYETFLMVLKLDALPTGPKILLTLYGTTKRTVSTKVY